MGWSREATESSRYRTVLKRRKEEEEEASGCTLQGSENGIFTESLRPPQDIPGPLERTGQERRGEAVRGE